MISERLSRPVFLGISVLIVVASTAVTIAGCIAMSSPDGMPMSMAWMRMPQQTWMAAAASFLGMWMAMMIAMMWPSLTPVLWRYRRAIGRTHAWRLDALTALAGAGYFFVWAVCGALVYALGSALAAAQMQWAVLARVVPFVAGTVVLAAGASQFTVWKERNLTCCRMLRGCGHAHTPGAGAAWRYGLRQGLHCSYCCAGPTAILLVIGMMDLRGMAIVTVAITAERLAPAGWRMAWLIGVIAIAGGLLLMAQASGVA